MRKCVLASLLLLSVAAISYSRDKKIYNGFEGGMMVHAGYLCGNIQPLGMRLAGCPAGMGGVARVRLGEHWRLGGEGYVSTLKVLDNGSYLKVGWGGILSDFYWRVNRFVPYAGLTVGGGSCTSLIMKDAPPHGWEPLGETYFNRRGFMAVAPFIGCGFVISDRFQLNLKADWLNAIGKDIFMPSGPRVYFGFVFCH